MKTQQIAFVGGEIAPSLHGRIDLAKVQVGVAKAENMVILAHGGAGFRPGSIFIAETKDSSKESRLIPFQFSTTQAYMIEVGDYYMRIYMNSGQIIHTTSTTSAWATSTAYAQTAFVKHNDVIYRCLQGHTSGSTTEPGVGASWETYWIIDDVFEILTPYADDDIWWLHYTQSADTLFLACEGYAPRELTRSGHTVWTLSSYLFKDGPFLKINETDTTLTLSAVSGSTGLKGESVDVTASASLFVAGDVGRWIKIKYSRPESLLYSGSYDINAEWTSTAWTVDGPFRIRYKFDSTDEQSTARYVEVSFDGGTTWEQYESLDNVSSYTELIGELRSEDYNDAVIKMRFHAMGGTPVFKWNVYSSREDRYALLKITSVTSGTVVRAEVMKTATYLGKPTKLWYLGAWGDTPGYPGVCMFFQGRLGWGRTTTEPQTVWLSKSNDFDKFGTSVPLTDEDAITLSLASLQVNAVQSMAPLKSLLIFTTGTEWSVSSGTGDKPITPTASFPDAESNNGANDLQPLLVGKQALYLDYYGNVVRDIGYKLESDGQDGVNRSLLASHLLDGYTVYDWAFQQSPWSVAWCARNDGKLLGLTFMLEHDVWAWHQHDLGGDVESVATIKGTLGNELWMIVKRTVNGATKRYVERLAFESEVNYLDCAMWLTGPFTTKITGLTHLAGETVSMIADGTLYEDQVVNASGEISITGTLTNVLVGIPYTGEIRTLPQEYETKQGASMGDRRKVTEVILRLLSSRYGWVGPDTSHLNPIQETLTASYTGIVKITPDTVFDEYGQTSIVQDKPYPFKVLSLATRIEHAD